MLAKKYQFDSSFTESDQQNQTHKNSTYFLKTGYIIRSFTEGAEGWST